MFLWCLLNFELCWSLWWWKTRYLKICLAFTCWKLATKIVEKCEVCSKVTKTLKRSHWSHFGVFIINLEHVSQFVLDFKHGNLTACKLFPTTKNIFQIRIKTPRKMCHLSSKLQEQLTRMVSNKMIWHRSGVFVANVGLI